MSELRPTSRSGEEYVDAGMAMARKIFEKRGNHSEVHLNEGELAGFLAIAISNGVAAAKQSPASEKLTLTEADALKNAEESRQRLASRSAERTQEGETPRTDAEVVRRNYGHDMIPADFARQLERELDGLAAMYRAAVKMIEEAPLSATSPLNWIPVSEHRPTLADCTTFDGLPVLLVLWDGKNPGCPVFDDSRGLPASITHWMRLPSHGKAEGAAK